MTLRPFRPEDAANLVELNADPAVREFLGEGPSTLQQMTDWIELISSEFPLGSSRGFWAAEEDGQFVGWFHLRPSRDTGETELGYRLAVSAWGRGLATEGSRALLQLAPNEKIIARTMIANVRSRRVMEKLGMSAVRTFPYSGEGPDDEVEYVLSVEDRFQAPS